MLIKLYISTSTTKITELDLKQVNSELEARLRSTQPQFCSVLSREMICAQPNTFGLFCACLLSTCLCNNTRQNSSIDNNKSFCLLSERGKQKKYFFKKRVAVSHFANITGRRWQNWKLECIFTQILLEKNLCIATIGSGRVDVWTCVWTSVTFVDHAHSFELGRLGLGA
jgi:hypothetical protein